MVEAAKGCSRLLLPVPRRRQSLCTSGGYTVMHGIGADDTIMHIGGCGDSLGTSETACGVIEHFARCEEPDAASSTARSGSATPSTTRSTSLVIVGPGAARGSALAATTERVELAHRLGDDAIVSEGLWNPSWAAGAQTYPTGVCALIGTVLLTLHTPLPARSTESSQDVSPAPSAYICPCPLTNP